MLWVIIGMYELIMRKIFSRTAWLVPDLCLLFGMKNPFEITDVDGKFVAVFDYDEIVGFFKHTNSLTMVTLRNGQNFIVRQPLQKIY